MDTIRKVGCWWPRTHEQIRTEARDAEILGPVLERWSVAADKAMRDEASTNV